MTQWQRIQVEETGTDRVNCDCCNQVTLEADGDLLKDAQYLGFYSISCAENSADHPPVISIYIGDWSETAGPEQKYGLRVVWHSEGCALLDWPTDNKDKINLFTPLDRDDILGTDFADHVWAMVDAVIMKDSRLEMLRS